MRKRYAPSSRWLTNAAILSALVALLSIAVISLPWLSRLPAPSIVTVDATPTAPVVEALATQKALASPVPPTATTVPVAQKVVSNTAVPVSIAVAAIPHTPALAPQTPALPDVGPGTGAGGQAVPTISTNGGPVATKAPAKPAPPVAKPADPNLLPNGVRYGDPRPNLPDRIVRIASPNVKLNTTVYEVYIDRKANVWEVADYAAGHNYNSANPGEGGNIVLSGHNNWRGEVFRYLEFLKLGDTIQLWTLSGKEYDYRVTNTQKLLDTGVSIAQHIKNAQVMNPTNYEQLTLITCWPYTTYTHRLIITALPVK
jgi:sortase A